MIFTLWELIFLMNWKWLTNYMMTHMCYCTYFILSWLWWFSSGYVSLSYILHISYKYLWWWCLYNCIHPHILGSFPWYWPTSSDVCCISRNVGSGAYSRFDSDSSGTLFYILYCGESSCSKDIMSDVGFTELFTFDNWVWVSWGMSQWLAGFIDFLRGLSD